MKKFYKKKVKTAVCVEYHWVSKRFKFDEKVCEDPRLLLPPIDSKISEELYTELEKIYQLNKSK